MAASSSSSFSSRNCRYYYYQLPHLPDECWESIFKHIIDPLDLESISLVSRQFHSFVNRTRTHLTISDHVIPHLPALLRRFTALTSIKLTPEINADIDALLSQIASFDLPSLHSLDISDQRTFPSHGLRQFSQKFPTLKSLYCSYTKPDLVLISECFPNLEEIDVSYTPVFSDADLQEKALASGLKKLRKVNLSGTYIIGDSSIFILCQNCKFLEELVVVCQTSCLCRIGFANAIRMTPQLRSFSVSNCNVTSELIDALVSLKGLTCLDLSYARISDDALCVLAEQGLPLRKLSLPGCKGCGYGGISCLLRKCNNLQYLDLQETEFLNDQCVIGLSLLLGNLKVVKLSENRELTDLSLFAILRNCPFITEIKMEKTGIGKHKLREDCLVVNSHVKCLYLARNSWLNDASVTMLASVCPNLEMMDLSICHGVSKGAIEVLWSCRKIQRMNLAHFGYDMFPFQFRVCFDVPTLFVLNLSGLGISNEDLSFISKSCYKLKELELTSCHKITTMGVKQAVKNCKQLRTITLSFCRKVSAGVVAWMVSARPSLRQIRPPPQFHFDEGQRDLFLRRGCFVGQ
ncbi:hypothetical protein PIB30_093026 [Stylosanthes scabra]|uniref:F-box domain-containing protein n=1 Tax=Stylosanthes scabra TaxID=79078 RepID=A0ABU6ZUE8_9FABA|nr:hypothetical protein [Stylosanthes scabra]